MKVLSRRCLYFFFSQIFYFLFFYFILVSFFSLDKSTVGGESRCLSRVHVTKVNRTGCFFCSDSSSSRLVAWIIWSFDSGATRKEQKYTRRPFSLSLSPSSSFFFLAKSSFYFLPFFPFDDVEDLCARAEKTKSIELNSLWKWKELKVVRGPKVRPFALDGHHSLLFPFGQIKKKKSSYGTHTHTRPACYYKWKKISELLEADWKFSL